jgi:hypothetical protein
VRTRRRPALGQGRRAGARRLVIGEGLAVSEAQIAVHWREEEDYYYPPAKFIAQANAADPGIFDFQEERFPECFKEYEDLLSWDAYYTGRSSLVLGEGRWVSVCSPMTPKMP